ncbi:MAG TPA: hypothetical protein VFR90_10430, partial [Methylibium sp.]|nr:hypothetical protein [Methylibium sp.]
MTSSSSPARVPVFERPRRIAMLSLLIGALLAGCQGGGEEATDAPPATGGTQPVTTPAPTPSPTTPAPTPSPAPAPAPPGTAPGPGTGTGTGTAPGTAPGTGTGTVTSVPGQT